MEDLLRTEYQECEPIHLEPFSHQVGGHSSILCLDERTVCKPLIKQELQFYETLPSSMKKFTPEYRGIVQVKFLEDPDGYITVVAYPQKSFHYQLMNKRRSKRKRFRLKNTGSIEIEIESELNDLFMDDEAGTSSSNSSRSLRAHNPWAVKCHQNQLSKLRRSISLSHAMKENEPLTQKFLVLENLTHRFEYPCVLDLKMGTRQYGDNATPAKIESKSAKAASSTSGQLGVRVCGMQVYQVPSGQYICKNKYYGRKLTVDGFKEAICQFLHNGSRLRTDALIPLIEKLQDLKTVLENLDTFRFYTSSLLLIYEGLDSECWMEDEISSRVHCNMKEPMKEGSEEKKRRLLQRRASENIPHSKSSEQVSRMKSLDEKTFNRQSNSTNPSPIQSPEDVENDAKVRKQWTMDGTNNHKYMNASHQDFGNSCRSSGSNTSSSSGSEGSVTTNRRHVCGSASTSPSLGSTSSSISLSSESVDVRLIDFAHSTHSGMNEDFDAKVHQGSDAGFMFGVSNLISVLQEIAQEKVNTKL